jgi:hypothetical protein
MAVFQVARANWLYSGAMMGSLTAVTILTHERRGPLVEQVLYVLGPSVVGFVGFALIRRYVIEHLAEAPAVRSMIKDQLGRARDEAREATLQSLRGASWTIRLVQAALPVLCVLAYLRWTGGTVSEHAIRRLLVPGTLRTWLLLMPYVVLMPITLLRDFVQIWILHRRTS